MDKRHIIMVLLMFGVIVAGTLAYLNSKKDGNNLTDQEIKKRYCHVTTEVRKTDVYCQSPALYREHARENKVIEN